MAQQLAHYDVYCEEIAKAYPGFGHALWEPGPGEQNHQVEVGDVGFIREGQFNRLFNVLLPGEHESHERFGVPEGHEPLSHSNRSYQPYGPHAKYVSLSWGLCTIWWTRGTRCNVIKQQIIHPTTLLTFFQDSRFCRRLVLMYKEAWSGIVPSGYRSVREHSHSGSFPRMNY